VLVLNQSYEPLTVCSPQKAITLLYLMKADIVEIYNDRFIHTINSRYQLPSVIKLSRYIRMPYRGVEINRKNVIKRDQAKCQYCGSRNSLTIDHVVPKSRGGLDTWENLITACVRCNNSKGNRTPKEAGMKMLTKPTKPNYIMYLKYSLGRVEDSWKQFLFY